MYQHSKNIARLINFEVYAVILVPNCKSNLSYVSLIKSREKDITSMSHLVTRIEQKYEYCSEGVRTLKQSFGMYAAPNRKKSSNDI